jgi:2-polyprenyl-6-methoxyphenol hydroxylase-like FAD-dependent oxidoreductase
VTIQMSSDDHAVVIGGSLAGLLAARALTDTFDHVTVIDRDALPASAVHRKGVPHSRHTHGLLAKGSEVLEELLPGLRAELVARGALLADLQRDILWYNEGHLLRPAPSGLFGLLASRPLLESYVRERVAALPRVEILAGTEAVGLRTDGGRISGVDVLGPDGAGSLPARVVVDATGRSNRGPAWLADLGYPEVPEDVVRAGLVYSTREYRRVPGAEDFLGMITAHHPANPHGAGVLATDGERWLVTLIGMQDDQPPTAAGQFEEYASRIDGPQLHRLLATAEPLTEAVRFHIGPSVRRRYERCPWVPDGFVAIGDALACFNPAYGQGMTAAAMGAAWLRTCLRRGQRGLTRRYFAGMTRIVDVPWDIATGADLRFPEVKGERTGRVRLLNSYMSRVNRAAASDPAVGLTFLKVANFLISPQRLVSPATLWRVWRGRRSVPGSPAGARPLVPSSRP